MTARKTEVVDLTLSDDEASKRTPKHRNYLGQFKIRAGDGSQGSPFSLDDLPRPKPVVTSSSKRKQQPFQNPEIALRNESFSSNRGHREPKQTSFSPVSTAVQTPAPVVQLPRGPNDWPKCLSCIESALNCDGERPCSECEIYGIDCTYVASPPKEQSLGLKAQQKLNPIEPPEEIPPRPLVEVPAPPKVEKVPEIARKEAFASVFDGIEIEEDTGSEISQVPFDNEAVANLRIFDLLFDEFQRKLHLFQEYTIRPLLQQSRTDAKSRTLHTVPQPTIRSPFAALSPKSTQGPDSGANLHLSVKDYNSQATTATQKWNSITTPIIQVESEVKSLPKYKSIGRMHSSVLARNVTIGKYNAYAPDDESNSWYDIERKYEELKERYHTYASISAVLHAQRDCAELVDLWRPWTEKLLAYIDIDVVDLVEYYTRDRNLSNNGDVDLPDSELAKWLEEQGTTCRHCQSGIENGWDESFPWEQIGSTLAPLKSRKSAFAQRNAGLLCFAFHDKVGTSIWHIVSTYPEIRKVLNSLTLDPAAEGQAQRMCVVCGLHNCSIHGAYVDDLAFQIDRSAHDVQIDDAEANRNLRLTVTLPLRTLTDSVKGTPKQPRRKKVTMPSRKTKSHVSKHKNLEIREVFVPCSHAGPCQDNQTCPCFKAQTACEHACGCNTTCSRRFKGCKCATGPSGVCNSDSSCECWNASRECDPWLCKSCGVLEVLDQANKYNEEIRRGRCCNNRIQLGIPARTIKAPSEVQGYGLFAGEDLEENDFIGEYKGEIISQPESDRRGAMYHLLGAEYLFILNANQQVDASNFGNKTRFMNNSNLERNINVLGCLMLCNGVHHIMLYAKRRIKAGEELLYNYSYPEEVSKNFWERGEQSSNKKALIEAKDPLSKRVTSGSKKPAEKEEEPDSSQSPVLRRKVKRKFDDVDAVMEDVNVAEESEYDSPGSVGSSESEEDSVITSTDGSDGEREVRVNRFGRKDGRFGGEAQRKGAKTKAKRLAEKAKK
jgi:SET domain/CXC domain